MPGKEESSPPGRGGNMKGSYTDNRPDPILYGSPPEMPVTPLDLPAAIVLIEGQKEQITTLTAQRDRLKRFWDTYAREVDKLAFEASEE